MSDAPAPSYDVLEQKFKSAQTALEDAKVRQRASYEKARGRIEKRRQLTVKSLNAAIAELTKLATALADQSDLLPDEREVGAESHASATGVLSRYVGTLSEPSGAAVSALTTLRDSAERAYRTASATFERLGKGEIVQHAGAVAGQGGPTVSYDPDS